MFWEIVGIAAAFCICVSLTPQLVKSFRTKRMDDFSLLFPVITTTGAFLWLAYGLHIGDAIVAGANTVVFVQMATLVVMKIRYSGKSAEPGG